MRRFLLVFVALLALSFGVELTPLAQAWFVTPWTDGVATVAAGLMRMFDSTITTSGNVIGSTARWRFHARSGAASVSAAITAGPLVASQTGFAAWQREAIAFAFQFGSLILPAVVPAVLWVAMHGRFIASLGKRSTAATHD